MADNEEENGMITIATGTLPSDAVIVANDVDQRVIQDDDAEDILQQAIQDAQEFGEEAVTLSYVTADGEPDHDPNANTSIVAQELGNNVNIVSVSESSLNTSVVGAPTGSTDNGVSYDVSYVVSDMNQTGNMTLEENMDTVMLTSTESQLDTASVVSHQIRPTENIVTMHATNFSNSVQQGGLNVTLVPANQNSVAPIGSSQNPIRIVQQGNQYTPVQQLTAEQLQQIMHVVQEQQLAKSTDSSNGSSILYNPQTNTRIVYRVIYPSELHKNTGSSDQLDNSASAISNPTGTDSSLGHRRTYKKRSREDDEDKVDGPEMSKEEKEERKKHRPRTRSGRVSKPPKHMVKDYKHIHVLDWDEDYDDSDGGYSDFKISDEDKSDPSSANNNNSNVNNNKGLDSSPDLIDASTGFERAKNYKCEGCDKAYIGHGGLRRHYQLNPSHGSIAEESDGGGGGGDKGNCISTPNALTNSRTNGSVGSISEDSNTQDSLPSQTTPSMSAKMYRPRGRGRGRPCQSLDIPSKRRAKLQDLVRQCTDDELMEIVLPRLANVITLWEFLMMKVEKGGKALPKVDDIYHEFGTLHKQVAKTCQDCLEPIPDTKSSSMPGDDKLQVDDAVLATCLGLKVGPYQVKPLPKEEKSFHYKYLTTEPQNIPAKRQNNRRTIEIVTPDELKQLGSKKTNMTTLLTSPVSVGSKAPQAAPVSLITSSNTTSSSSPLSLLSTPISSSQSATPMQIVVNNHNSVSESVQLPVTSHLVNSVVTNNGILHNNALQRQPPHTTVLLTNCATLPSSTASFTTLNGTSALTVNGNGSVLETSKNASNSLPVLLPPTSSVMTTANGTSVDRSTVNSVFVSNNNNNAVKMDNGQRQNVNESLLSGFVCSVAQENNSVPLKTPDMIVNKLEDVSDDLTVSMDQSEPMDIQVQLNGACVQETSALQSQVGEPVVSMGELEGEQVFNAEQIEGEIISPDQIVTQASNIFQTEDGTLIIQNPDGTTFQLQGAEGIPLETVQALLAMDGEGQYVEQEQMQAEMQ